MSEQGMQIFDPLQPLRRGITLVEASAGTGKTFGITSLLVRLLVEIEGLELSQILVVTFTRAATAELRWRVRARIRDALAALERARAGLPLEGLDPVIAKVVGDGLAGGPGELDRRLLVLSRAYASFDEAAISTIHGFCQQTLLQSAFETRVALDAEPVSDIDELLQEVVDDFWSRELTDAPLDWLRVLDWRNVTRDELRQLASDVASNPDATFLPASLSGDRGGGEARSMAGTFEEWLDEMGALARCWAVAGPRLVDALLTAFKDGALTERSKKLYNSSQPKKRGAVLDAWAGAHREGAAPEDVDEVLLGAVDYFSRGDIAGILADPAGGLPGESDPAVSALLDAAERAARGPAEQFLRRFVDYVRVELPRRKEARSVLSFDDLLRTLASRITEAGARDALRASIRQRFKVALIDEFQDTDPVQWTIFREAFGEGAFLFLIGDPKQAIYAFRGADLNTYVGARDHAGAGRFTMRTNWRSDARYLRALNHLLDREGVFGQQDVTYVAVDAAPHHERDGLVPSSAAPLRLVYFDRALTRVGKGKRFATKGWAHQHLPRHLAREVVELLQSGDRLVLERGEDGEILRSRPVVPGDLAVLVRTHREAASMQQALLDSGVPAVIEGGQSVFETPEALELQRVLEAMVRPVGDRSARTALVGALFGMSGDELAAMADADWDQWLGRFSSWAETWREHGFMRAFRRLLVDAEVIPETLSHRGGERVLTNLMQLAELLHHEETESRLGPVGLLAWLEERRAAGRAERDEEQLRLESDADAVTVATMHAAKGLEYPVVWCPSLWNGRPLTELRRLRVHDPAHEPPQVLDLHLSPHLDPKRTHIEMARYEQLTENLRLLYVALTRARHRCTVYWGPFGDATSSPLASVLHGGVEVGPARLERGAERVGSADDEVLYGDLESIASGSGGTIEIVRASPLEQRRWEPTPGAAADVKAREFSRDRLDSWWRRGSFSSLVRSGGGHEVPEGMDEVQLEASPAAEGIDHDDALTLVLASEGPERGASDALEDVPLATFPRGADAGTFLHAVLEYVDFQAGEPGLEVELDRLMPRHGIDAAHREALLEGLGAAIETPLGGPLEAHRLADVGRVDRLDEMSFDLPVAGGFAAGAGDVLSSRALASVFSRHADEVERAVPGYVHRVASLGFGPPLRGFLTGQIDLVFRFGARAAEGEAGRWFVVDYKSNWLGERREGPSGGVEERCGVAHYAPEHLAEAMGEHHYVLQYHLYLLALHRYLRWRLGSSYDYDRHIGGAYYLFLRGMVGPRTPVAGDRRHGVFFHRPSRALIEDLDRAFAGGGR